MKAAACGGHRDFATTLIYADYQPSKGEAELVERAFAPDARINSRIKESDSQRHSKTLNPHESTEPDLSV
jgi:hypothetical protein